ncbi:unnamed protein product, partial [Meganyctiphanes norvegica]
KPHYQLVSLHGSWKRPGEVRPRSAPLAYILMQGKAEEDYISVFRELKSLVEDGGGSMKLKRVLVDFELAIWNAVHVVWGETVKIRGCWFHFNQCIHRFVVHCGLGNIFRKHNLITKMIKRLMVLPLMDPMNIPPLFSLLKQRYHATINGDNTAVKDLFDYFESQWISGRFSPDTWSCFECVIRTNNHVESWNGHVLRKAERKGKNIYLLSELLAKDAIVAMNDLDNYSNRYYIKKTQATRDALILAAYARYKEHKKPWDALESLRHATAKHCNWGNAQINESDNDETTESDSD